MTLYLVNYGTLNDVNIITTHCDSDSDDWTELL